MEKYCNFISLGYFCSVATELEKLGFRSASYPFDWTISNFEGVIDAINSNFEDFLDYNLLRQSNTNKSHYFNVKYRIWFYHDFDSYLSLRRQLPNVKKKYNRRIERFYNSISEPTLFFRYISDEICDENNKSVELDFIEKNYHDILSLLKSYNSKNEIVFIANSSVKSDIIHIYNVEKDENDVVSRKPIENNNDLLNFLESLDYSLRDENLQYYSERQNNLQNNVNNSFYSRLKNYIKHNYSKEYIHNLTIDSSIK